MTVVSEYLASAGYRNAGDETGFRIARAYRANRQRLMQRGYTATPERCLAMARADIERGANVYPEPKAAFGAPSDRGGRWTERPEALGFRFLGWSDEIGGRYSTRIHHTGWYVDSGEETLARGCVYLLPSRDGRTIYVEAVRIGETNRDGAWQDMGADGAAMIYPNERHYGERYGAPFDTEEAAFSAAKGADEEARIYAESSQRYDNAYNDGRRAAEADSAALEAAQALRALIVDVKARFARSERHGLVWDVLERKAAGYRYTMTEARAKRDLLWANVRGDDETPWLAGFMDESADGRAHALGYVKGETE